MLKLSMIQLLDLVSMFSMLLALFFLKHATFIVSKHFAVLDADPLFFEN